MGVFNKKEGNYGSTEEKPRHDIWKTKSKMTDVNPPVSTTTLHVSALSIPITRQNVSLMC